MVWFDKPRLGDGSFVEPDTKLFASVDTELKLISDPDPRITVKISV